MARPLRIEFPGALYHVTSRGNERKPIYRNDRDRDRFLEVLADVVERFRLLVHAYVLMDNHYHLLIETLEANLTRAMHRLNARHAQGFNWTHRRSGHLFQGRYKALLVDRDTYLLELSRYIHLNPVRAGMIEHAERYRWSSASAYVGRRRVPAFLTVAEVLGHFGRTERRASRRYAEFLRCGENALDAASPLDRVVAQTLLGDSTWIQQIMMRVNLHDRLDAASEIPAVNRLCPRPHVGEVISAVASVMKVDALQIRRSRSPSKARAVAIYLAAKSCGLPLRLLGDDFGVGYSAISKAATNGGRIVSTNNHLRRLEDRLFSKRRD